MAFIAAQPIMIQSPTFICNATAIAHLPVLFFQDPSFFKTRIL